MLGEAVQHANFGARDFLAPLRLSRRSKQTVRLNYFKQKLFCIYWIHKTSDLYTGLRQANILENFDRMSNLQSYSSRRDSLACNEHCKSASYLTGESINGPGREYGGNIRL